MRELIEEATRLRDRAKVQRKRGDALSKAGNEELAKEAFGGGVKLLEEAADKLKDLDEAQVAEDLAETMGAMGGMLRRLGDERQAEALQAYEDGADVEWDHGLSSTYNRLNTIKFRLLTGSANLAELKPTVQTLADLIEKSLRSDSTLSDSGWAWADLGDCHALLGNLSAAQEAYATFIEKAEIKSPETTLQVLNELAQTMKETNDPDAESVREAAATLQTKLTGTQATK